MPSNVEKLEKDLAAAREAEAQAVEQAQTARAQYQAAVESGDMDKAAEHQAEAQRLDGVAQMHADRVETLEGQRAEAESKDAAPAYKKAKDEADAAIQAEADAHAKVAEAIRHLQELRTMLDDVHAETGRKIAAAQSAAKNAHQRLPEFAGRSRLQSVADVEGAFRVTRELANVGNFQAQQVMNARERARKAA